MTDPGDTLDLLDWRRRVAQLYAAVRGEADAVRAHAAWRAGRDKLFLNHPQSPLHPDDPLRDRGLPYWPYDPALRVRAELVTAEPEERVVETSSDGRITLHRVGRLEVEEFGFTLDAWWLAQYGGGLFVPIRDGSAGAGSYGGGRYLLDTAKGADLGTDSGAASGRLVLDFNFLYHPSCRYNSRWECPLAPPGNTTPVALVGGERMPSPN